ncbi:MAG TPA: hypothetical protein VF486_20130 [Actinomycetes bacterium]
MRLPGHEDAPLVDGAPLLEHRLFWPAHLLQVAGERDGLLAACFGVTAADVGAFYERTLADPRRWPTLPVPLRDDHQLYVVGRNVPEDYGQDYLLHHPTWPTALRLASIEGHFVGPGVCWPELLAASVPPPGAVGITQPAARLLLLLPILGDAATPREAAAIVADALAACGAVGSRAVLVQLAGQLLTDHRLWPPARWWHDARANRVCDGGWSARNPAHAWALPHDELAWVTWALAPA